MAMGSRKKKERQEHKAAMDRLGAYRNESSGMMSTVGRYAGAALAGGAAGVAAEKVRDNLSGDDDEKGESNASESTFDFSRFGSDQPLLESRTGGGSSGNGGRGPDGPPSSDGGGDRHFDFEDSEAEERDGDGSGRCGRG